jgi:outer membrane protein assembly factor BamB
MRSLPALSCIAFLIACNPKPDDKDAGAKPKLPQIADDPTADLYMKPPGGAPAALLDLNRKPPNIPPSQAGSSSAKAIPVAQRTSYGYEIRFGNASPITTPAVHDGHLLVSGGFNSREIFAFDATTGRGQWGRALSDDGPSAPVCEGSVCAFNTESCTTFALDAKTGETKWAWWLGDPETSAPAIANGRLFASYPSSGNGPSGATHVLAAFDLQTGKIAWQRWLDADVMSSPVASGNYLYVTTFAGTIMKLDQATGDIRYAVELRATSAPVIVHDGDTESLFVSERIDERVREKPREAVIRADLGADHITFRANPKAAPYLDGDVQVQTAYAQAAHQADSINGFGSTPATANAGTAKAIVGVNAVSAMQGFQGSHVVYTKTLVISTMSDEVVAIDPKTGDKKWSHSLTAQKNNQGGAFGTSPILAGNDVIVGTLGGDIVRLDVTTGNVRATYSVHAPIRAAPIAMNGWIYAGTEDGRLVAIQTNDPSVTGWPVWGGDASRNAVRM